MGVTSNRHGEELMSWMQSKVSSTFEQWRLVFYNGGMFVEFQHVSVRPALDVEPMRYFSAMAKRVNTRVIMLARSFYTLLHNSDP